MFVIWGPESSHQAALTRRFCHQLRSPKVSRHFGCHKDKPDFLSAPGNCTIVKNKPNSCWLLTVLHLNRLAMKLWQIDLYISVVPENYLHPETSRNTIVRSQIWVLWSLSWKSEVSWCTSSIPQKMEFRESASCVETLLVTENIPPNLTI